MLDTPLEFKLEAPLEFELTVDGAVVALNCDGCDGVVVFTVLADGTDDFSNVPML